MEDDIQVIDDIWNSMPGGIDGFLVHWGYRQFAQKILAYERVRTGMDCWTGYLTGQRVILNNREIGTVCKPERPEMPNTDDNLWVFSPLQGYASYYAVSSIRPLPDGQL